MKSASTQVVIEFKNRNYFLSDFYDQKILIEKQKFKNLKNGQYLLDAPALYIVEFYDGVLIFDLSSKNKDQIEWSNEEHDKNNCEKIKKEKVVGYLHYASADFIISKRDWRRKSYKKLNEYLNEKLK